jgi:hypothetical protein
MLYDKSLHFPTVDLIELDFVLDDVISDLEQVDEVSEELINDVPLWIAADERIKLVVI